MESIRQYILSIIAAAIICGIINAWFGSKGAAGTVIKLVAGLFMTVTLLSSATHIQLTDFALGLSDISATGQNYAQAGQINASEAISDIIKQQTQAYILDKAASMELNLEVEVTLSETDPPAPDSVVLKGQVSPYAKIQLTEFIFNQLGIAKENQIWK